MLKFAQSIMKMDRFNKKYAIFHEALVYYTIFLPIRTNKGVRFIEIVRFQ